MKRLTEAGKKDIVFTPAGYLDLDVVGLVSTKALERKKPTEQTRAVCSYFQAGRCKNGSDCQYQHGTAETYRFFLRGEDLRVVIC
jgi:hypothetical protein